MRPITLPETDLYNRNVEQNDEINLVQAASDGDIDSFSRLCERYYPAITAIAYSQLFDRGLAEDAAQETLFVAFRDILKLKKAKHFGRWLAGICRNIASDMAKARKRERLIPTEDCESFTSEDNKQDSHDELVRSIIARLPDKMREVIYLRYYNKMSYQEISKLLGISQEAVNGRLRRAKKIIAKELVRRASVEVNL